MKVMNVDMELSIVEFHETYIIQPAKINSQIHDHSPTIVCPPTEFLRAALYERERS